MTSEAALISIVIPVFDEALNIAPLCQEIHEALGKGPEPYEVVFVDDGSRDGTFDALKAEQAKDSRVRAVRFRKNSGKAAAYAAGFKAARGDLIATMDGDLQDDPKDILKLRAKVEEGTDLVIGWKKTGKSSPTTFVLSKVMNLLLRWVTKLRLHDMNCPLRVMRCEVAQRLELRSDLHRYIPLLATSKGFSVAEVPVDNRPRKHGQSKYTGSKYLSSTVALLGVGLYLRWGDRPMGLFGGLGLLSFLTGFIVCVLCATRFLFFGADIDDDLPTLMLGGIFIGIGTQFLSLGLLAEILVRRLSLITHSVDYELIEEI